MNDSSKPTWSGADHLVTQKRHEPADRFLRILMIHKGLLTLPP